MKGGHARSGPPPDPEALRRDRPGDPGWVVLPVTGRSGPAPEWPLPSGTERELAVWAGLWAKPQATQWERLGQVTEVALYTRRLCEVEQEGASAALGNLVIRLGEALGLTIPGLRMNRWQIAGEQAPGPLQPPEQPPPGARRSARSRLTVVPSDGAA